MLILSVEVPRVAPSALSPQQSVTIVFPNGEKGTFTLFSCSESGRVKIGIEMPPDIDILRGRLIDKVTQLQESIQ